MKNSPHSSFFDNPAIEKDVIIIGAGAAGMMCAISAGERGKKTILIDHSNALAQKIRISGGGRCNFTNQHIGAEKYISENPHFCRSALSRFTTQDFLRYIHKHHIQWHEKKLGQLFLNNTSRDIIEMLRTECLDTGSDFLMGKEVIDIDQQKSGERSFFRVQTNGETFSAPSLVVASGGVSVPETGASPIGYQIARQFGLNVTPLKPGLVPLTTDSGFPGLAGISIDTIVSLRQTRFRENILFTHRGLSGPAILQISSYWNPGDMITLDLLPDLNEIPWTDLPGKINISTALVRYLPKKFAQYYCHTYVDDKPISHHSPKELKSIEEKLHTFSILPTGTEGFRKAEVTVGGVSTHDLSSKTMESRTVPGLFFIGEVVDVTGWLGGYNFQWAWSSGHTAGRFV